MACFLVPAAEAVVTTAVKKCTDKKETDNPFIRRINWLSNMLWGGAGLLAFEHVWHGEVVPWFPFLTGTITPAAAAQMLHEMATSGVAMAVLVTVVWVGLVIASHVIEKRPVRESITEGAVQ